ncbi:hypothetical protein CLOP_g22132 [Closterium sp. NIES-67]|nr:hypothetical protein CLOP_g22132 [Closterium sp. NIES-67]
MGSSDASGSTPSYSFLPCIASGSSDSTVRVWSLLPSGKGRSACVATLKGHEGPITALAVAIHNPFLLTSVARDAKLRLWDCRNIVPSTVNPPTTSSSSSSLCIGTCRTPTSPFALLPLPPHASRALCLVAGRGGIAMIDLLPMKQVHSLPCGSSPLASFSSSPSRHIIAAGFEDGYVRMWRVGPLQEGVEAGGPHAALTVGSARQLSACIAGFKLLACSKAHNGTVDFLYLDSYKCISGSRGDGFLSVWDAETGEEIRTLDATAPPPWLVEAEDESDQGDGDGDGEMVVTMGVLVATGMLMLSMLGKLLQQMLPPLALVTALL